MADFVFWLLRMFQLLILVRVILSWVHPFRDNQFVDWIYRLTEPFLEPIRRVLPTAGTGLDLSPLILLLLLQFLSRILVSIL